MIRQAHHALLAALLIAPAFVLDARAADTPGNDAPGSRDSPLLARYKDARIIAYDQSDDDEATLPSGPYRDFGFTATVKPEGRITRIAYVFPSALSSITIMKHYRDVLKGGGFRILFHCSGHDGCGGFNFGEGLTQQMAEAHGGEPGSRIIDILDPVGGDIRYVLATLDRPQGRVTIALAVAHSIGHAPGLFIETVEQPPPDMTAPAESATRLASALRVQGRIALYGVRFAPDKAIVRPASRAVLAQIATMLRADTAMKLIIVGNTDTSEPLEQALPLSTAQAQAVMQALVRRWKVPPAQLAAIGVGPAAPIASNADAAGRTLNRRIELVLDEP